MSCGSNDNIWIVFKLTLVSNLQIIYLNEFFSAFEDFGEVLNLEIRSLHLEIIV